MFCVQTGNLPIDLAVNILIFVIGTAILVKGSDIFIDAAADIARLWGVSELVIGLTLVSIGTSLPELASSVYAAFKGQGDFIIGNIVGSNVTNISLILAIGIIGMGIMPFERKMLTRDGTFMLLIYLVCAGLFAVPLRTAAGATVRGIDFRGGIILLIFCAAYLYLLFRQKTDSAGTDTPDAEKSSGGKAVGLKLLLLLLGVAMITAGSKGMVDPVVWGAQKLGISMLVISSTIVAFGTSVPELAVTIAGLVKHRHDIALGNIIGSNIFNILLIFGVTSCIQPLILDLRGAGLFNLAAMGVTGVLLILFMLVSRTGLKRRHGLVLLLLYAVFMLYNCRAALGK
ncbi:MAG: calcium/sodium antiporter [Lentisphaeria bacterium]|nr:calcium/sodium antiporter [Lentisphaeria bacterium]